MAGILYVAVSEYLVPRDEVMEHLDEHRVWVKKSYDDGVMLASGPQEPGPGGVLIFLARDADEAQRFIASDPLEVTGVVKYRVTGFQPTPEPWRSRAYDVFLSGPDGS